MMARQVSLTVATLLVMGLSFLVTALLGVPLAAMLVVPVVLACPLLAVWLLQRSGHGPVVRR
jgi:hypothetical protein